MSGFLKKTVKFTFKNNFLKVLQNRPCSSSASSPPPKSPSKSPPKSPSKSPSKSSSKSASSGMNVPGLSDKVVSVPASEVGPGASKKAEYKNPEYFCYHNKSYFEAEIEMLKYRCPQPSNKVPFNN